MGTSGHTVRSQYAGLFRHRRSPGATEPVVDSAAVAKVDAISRVDATSPVVTGSIPHLTRRFADHDGITGAILDHRNIGIGIFPEKSSRGKPFISPQRPGPCAGGDTEPVVGHGTSRNTTAVVGRH